MYTQNISRDVAESSLVLIKHYGVTKLSFDNSFYGMSDRNEFYASQVEPKFVQLL